MDKHATHPDIDRAIRRLRELGWKVAAKEVQPGLWVVDCETHGFGFFEEGATAWEAWLAALAKVGQRAKQYAGWTPSARKISGNLRVA